MSTTTATRPRAPLSKLDRAILGLHAAVAATVGIVAYLGADDPEFGSLQRIVVMMVIGLWAAGIVAMAVIARLVRHQWLRAVILLAGPFVGIALLLGTTMLA